ncbi:hypothetical protein [Amycolatopsis taiwanensis]|uniref:hypothetical protein n=1 Tax=Amycolatopsis taiwanensis TaxID=342230 RepID=UPI000487B7C0|nr:hypothetical protein [Amycolatopsis taiwanensis]
MADWQVDSGELAASASKVGAEARTLAGLARELDAVLVETADFDAHGDVAGRYTRVVSTQLAGQLHALADEAGILARDLSASAHTYDSADEDAARFVAGEGSEGA